MYIIAPPSISAQTGQTRKSGITCPWPLDPTSPDLFGAFDLLIVSFGSFWIRGASAECSQYPKLFSFAGNGGILGFWNTSRSLQVTSNFT